MRNPVNDAEPTVSGQCQLITDRLKHLVAGRNITIWECPKMTIIDSPELRQATDCPVCHQSGTFRPKGVMGQFWIKRCMKCRYYKEWHFPPIRKKIIYLDQNVLSHIISGRDPRWQEVYRRLLWLSYLQVITCPYSDIHREESLLAEHSRDQLKAIYRELSDGNKFLSPIEIEQNQLIHSIRRYLGEDENHPSPDDLRYYREFCAQNPNFWTLDLQVYVDFPTDLQVIDHMQKSKVAFQSNLRSVANNWKSEGGRRFEEDVKREVLAYGEAKMEEYQKLADSRKKLENNMPAEFANVYRQIIGDGMFDPNTPLGNQPGILLVHWLACEVHKACPQEHDPTSVVEQFFRSDEAMNTAFQFISSHLWAGVAQKARTKKPRSPEGNDKNDISAISHYAPYCDVMIVDNFFLGLTSQRNINIPERFNVKMFSARTLPAFNDYLDDLLFNIPLDHRKALKMVIPNISLIPFLNTD